MDQYFAELPAPGANGDSVADFTINLGTATAAAGDFFFQRPTPLTGEGLPRRGGPFSLPPAQAGRGGSATPAGLTCLQPTFR